MADLLSTSGADLFSLNSSTVQNQRSQVAQYAIYRASTYLSDNKQDEALRELKKALAFDPQNATAHTYIGKIYLNQNKTADAIKEFKSVVQNDRTSVTALNNLGNAYLQAAQNGDAESTFKAAARMDPLNPVADYTLGLLYTKTGRYKEAEAQFSKVAKNSPTDGNVYYSLGVLYNKMERPEDAVKNLTKALTLKKDFPAANYELGAAYVSLGETEKANDQLKILKSKNNSLATDLSYVINKPKILFMDASNSNGFNQALGARTPLWMLDPTLLSTPDASKQVSVAIQFNNKMDVASVLNLSNWEISRANNTAGGHYNDTMPVGENEVSINKRPYSVSYDPTTLQANVTFIVTQNSTIDILGGNYGATIDPAHLVFKFSGKDAAGRKMDTTGDQIDGHSVTAF